MTEREIRLRRTVGSGPPSDLAFGEAAFSEDDEAIYVGRFDEEDPPVVFHSDYSDFEDAIAALQAYAVINKGFTYDQQVEPSGPATGATWRERSGGGLILGEWEWSGSAWIGLQKHWSSLITPAGALSASTVVAAELLVPFYGVMLLERVVFNYALVATPDATNYWQIMFSMVNYAGSAGATGNPEAATTLTLNTTNTAEVSQTHNLLVTAGRARIKATKFAAAPNLARIVMLYQWRAVR